MEIKCDIRRFRGKCTDRRTEKGCFPQNLQQNKGGPMSCRPCIAGEHRSVRPGCPYVELCYIEPPAWRPLYHRKTASPCETTKKIAKNSALCINYSTLFPFCTPPTFRRISPPFADSIGTPGQRPAGKRNRAVSSVPVKSHFCCCDTERGVL